MTLATCRGAGSRPDVLGGESYRRTASLMAVVVIIIGGGVAAAGAGCASQPIARPRMDRAAAAGEASDRRRLYAEAQRLIAEDLPYITVWSKTNFAIARRELSGVRLGPLADFMFLRHVARTSIPAR